MLQEMVWALNNIVSPLHQISFISKVSIISKLVYHLKDIN